MRTVYVRNVPDEVVEALEEMAGREGLSLNAFVTRELTQIARRAKNAEILGVLPDLGTDIAWAVSAVRDDRDAR